MDALDKAAVHTLRCVEAVVGVDPLDYEDSVLQRDLAGHFGGEISARCIDPTRLQRAPEGAG
jgi:hypothetical protein